MNNIPIFIATYYDAALKCSNVATKTFSIFNIKLLSNSDINMFRDVNQKDQSGWKGKQSQVVDSIYTFSRPFTA